MEPSMNPAAGISPGCSDPGLNVGSGIGSQ